MTQEISDNPLKTRLLRKPRFVPLRVRFILSSTMLLILVLGVLAGVLGLRQRHTIRAQLEQRGLAIANSLGNSSLPYLLTYNYVALESSANQVAQDPDLTYVIYHDKEGRVAGHSSRPDLQNSFLSDPESRRAVNSSNPLVQEVRDPSGSVIGLEVAVPVYPQGVQDRWGSVRVGLSLGSMYQQIRQTQWIIAGIGMVALSGGVLFSLLMARRITKPLADLAAFTQAAARGDLTRTLDVRTADEVEILAANFTIMTREILTHREQLEKRLEQIQHLKDYTERLLTTMSDGLLSIDMEGRLGTVNPAACRILSSTPDKENFSASLKKTFPELGGYLDEIRQEPIDRRPREIRLNGSSIGRVLLVASGILKDRTGRPQEIILNLHDITELKKLEASVRQSERLAALGTLAAGMAHEIRNPLSSIKTFAQLLPRKVTKPGFLEKFQRTVPRELERINHLVEDLLELSRTPNYTYSNADLRPLILRHIEFMEEELQLRKISCDCKLPELLPFVRIDERQLSKAFHNLIMNALQAMPLGGRLTISVSAEPDEVKTDALCETPWVRICFADTGGGIGHDEMKSIFNPFFTTKDGGTGLGLSITHKVVVEHGGLIDVESRQGEGTSFVIKLPACC